MELSPTTFLLEVVNFLILIWVLKRLFFAPVKKAIESRKAEIKQSLNEAVKEKERALELQHQYEGRMKTWSAERESRERELKSDIDAERGKRMRALEGELSLERERLLAKSAAEQAEKDSEREKVAIQQSAKFLSKLLSEVASEELEAALIRLLIRKIQKHPDRLHLPGDSSQSVKVATAYELPKNLRDELLTALFPERQVQSRIERDPSLIAGIELSVGSMIFKANLRDELSYFSEVERGVH